MIPFSRHRQLLLIVALTTCGAGCAGPAMYGAGAPAGHGTTVPAPQSQRDPSQVPPQNTLPVNPSPAAKQPSSSETEGEGIIIRGQTPAASPYSGAWSDYAPGSDGYRRGPTPVSGGAPVAAPYPSLNAPQGQPQTALPYGQPYQYGAPPPVTTYQQPAPSYPPVPSYPPAPTYTQPPTYTAPPLPPPPGAAGDLFNPGAPGMSPPSVIQPLTDPALLATPAPVDILVEETRTGRFMFGVAVNSDAGVTGQVTIQENNFDITRWPTSVDDVVNGTAWRGAGQGFRIEAQPGSQVQRYLVSFTEPYFLGTNVSMNASGFYFDRNYFDWDESRYGGRLGLGYRLTPDLSVSGTARVENVSIFNPRILGVPELDAALGRNELYGGRASIIHDTRDLPFMPTEGHFLELSYEQVFGDFDYPRGEIDFKQYWLMRERPDGSGRHTLAYSSSVGFSGSDTPIFENYFAGGFSTLRGFEFRGASPIDMGVQVGGEFRWINAVEYFFPLTADDMIKGVVFCDFGTVERDIALRGENFRVAPGFGLRINVPALGPAPLAFDFAFPVASADTDQEQVFSFFFGASRQ